MVRNLRDGDRSRTKGKKGTKVNRREALVEKMREGRVKVGLGEFGMDDSARLRLQQEEEDAARAAAERAEAEARAEQEDEDSSEEEPEEPRKRGKKGKKFIDVCGAHTHAPLLNPVGLSLFLLLLLNHTEKRDPEPD